MAWGRVLLAAVLLLSAGCLGDDGDAASTGPLEEGNASQGATPNATPRVVHDENHWTLGVSTTLAQANVLGDGGHPVVDVALNGTGFTSTLTWNASTPASEELWFRIQHLDSGTFVAQENGTSPVTLSVPEDRWEGPGRYALVVRASGDPAGVFVAQTYQLETRIYEGIAFQAPDSGTD